MLAPDARLAWALRVDVAREPPRAWDSGVATGPLEAEIRVKRPFVNVQVCILRRRD